VIEVQSKQSNLEAALTSDHLQAGLSSSGTVTTLRDSQHSSDSHHIGGGHQSSTGDSPEPRPHPWDTPRRGNQEDFGYADEFESIQVPSAIHRCEISSASPTPSLDMNDLEWFGDGDDPL
jgi:hypothetical protein